MSEREHELLAALDNCIRAMGHKVVCRMLRGPGCDCGAAKFQAIARDEAIRVRDKMGAK